MRPYQTNNFNFIRFVLASMVLLSHAPELIDGNRRRELLSIVCRGNFSFGEVAVAGFFILSGYLITKSWHEQPDLVKFLEKRVRRIFPAFIVASFVSALVVGPLGAQSSTEYFSNLHPLQFLLGVFTLSKPVIPAVFLGQPYPEVNGAMWTIPVEFSCYLAIAAIGIIFGFRRLVWIAIMAVLLGICAIEYSGHHFSWFESVHPNLALYFAAGSCFYVYRGRVRFTPLFAVAAALILCVGMFSYRAHQLIFSLTGSYLLFYFAYAKISLLANFGRLPDVSYGLYLYGWPIQKLIIWWFPEISPWALFPVSGLAAIIAGWASWHLIEKRLIKSKRNASIPSVLPPDSPTRLKPTGD